MVLRTSHAPLNCYLHRLGKVESLYCPHCSRIKETVHHLLTACQHYQHARHSLIQALGRKATSIPFLLMNEEAIPHLIRFINATGRMITVFGEVPFP
jgi:hypothetical protein